MRGDQLARQWRIIRAIEANPKGLTVIEIAQRRETRIRMIYRELGALQAAGFSPYTERVEKANRWAFIDTLKFKIPPPFALTELMSFYFYKDLVRVLKGSPFYYSLDSVFKRANPPCPSMRCATWARFNPSSTWASSLLKIMSNFGAKNSRPSLASLFPPSIAGRTVATSCHIGRAEDRGVTLQYERKWR